jgi:hypothetical protein
MAVLVMIYGQSGTGKSTSLRNFKHEEVAVINVSGKPLPFRGDLKPYNTDNYTKIINAICNTDRKSIVIDDAGYLITNQFMRGHSNTGAGNAVFAFYNTIADYFWSLIQFIMNMPEDKIVYVIMHEDTDDNGDTRPKTIGKLLDEKVCVEGMFTIVLRCIIDNGEHLFVTQAENRAVSKSPKGMFEEVRIPNDLRYVDEHIRDYYDIARINYEAKESEEVIKNG